MSDDKNKRHADSRTISSQPWEIDYARKKLRDANPGIHQTTINTALTKAKRQAEPSESRTKIINQAQKLIDER